MVGYVLKNLHSATLLKYSMNAAFEVRDLSGAVATVIRYLYLHHVLVLEYSLQSADQDAPRVCYCSTRVLYDRAVHSK